MSRPYLLSTLLFVLVSLAAASAGAQTCHDGLWPDGEFCGYDSAIATTGVEMNHDCVNDFLDLILFSREMGMTGMYLSADLDGNSIVNLADATLLAAYFLPLGPVSPCNPSPATLDDCAGHLALSLDPASIVSRGRFAAPGLTTVYVVASGWTNAGAIEYTLDLSPNLLIVDDASPVGWLQAGSYGGAPEYVWDGTAAPVSGTTVLIEHTVLVLDNQPAYIQLVDSSTSLTRWAPPTLDVRNEFRVRRHVGINRIDPLSNTVCPATNLSPTVAITDPVGAISVPNATTDYTVAGTAADTEAALSFVEVRVNDGDWQPAAGTSAWSLSVPLDVGENWIQVRSADTGDAYSQTQVVTITRLDRPDLLISAWYAPPDMTLPHGCTELDVDLVVSNASGDTSPATRIGFYLSDDPIIDGTDHLVAWRPVSSLAAGGTEAIITTVIIPDDGPRGPVYFGAFVDDLNEVDETNETNNTDWCDLELESPSIVSIEDVRNDQGRLVRVNFLATSRDVPSTTPILQYEVFRRIDPLPAGTLPKPAAEVRLPRISGTEKLAGWEYVGGVPAHCEAEYNAIVPTLADSTTAGLYWSYFFVRAATAEPWVFFDSCIDSGYSVDNLAPGAPSGLLVAYAAEGNQLRWEANLEDDLQYYRIYRGPEPDFVPDEANLVEATAETEWLDTADHPWWHNYKITAVDFAGNESPVAQPQELTGAPDLPSMPTRFALHQCVPNPFNPSTRIEYDLPEDAFVRLAVYATNGHLIRTLVNEFVSRGRQEAAWDGTDRSGRVVAAGVYFYRIEAGAFDETMRMVLLK